MKTPHCHIHADTPLQCPRCAASERGRKGGKAKSEKQDAARAKTLAKLETTPAERGRLGGQKRTEKQVAAHQANAARMNAAKAAKREQQPPAGEAI